MNNKWNEILNKDLCDKKVNDSYRELRIINEINGKFITLDNKTLINFASNDYLGLSNDRRIIDAGKEYAEEWGAGSGASRLVTGTLKPFIDIEEKIAGWIGKQKALFFNSGYHANIGILSVLVARNSVIFTDKLNHASIYDGCLLSRAEIVRYPHRDVKALKKLLYKHKDIDKKIIITDSVFSMEGDISPLREIIDLAKEYDGLAVVDEAHSIGIFGKEGTGLANELNLMDEVDIIMGTLGKAFGVFGAFIAGSDLMISYLVNNCRPFIFTTALPPFVIGAVSKALDIISKENRGINVLKKAERFRDTLKNNNIDIGDSATQIVPIIVGSNGNAVSLMNHLKENGFFAPAIRPPTVPVNKSRVRISFSYLHDEDEIERLAAVIIDWFKKVRMI